MTVSTTGQEMQMENDYKDAPLSFVSIKYPEKDVKLIDFDNHSKYLIKIEAKGSLEIKLYEYAERFYEAAHRITDFILNEKHPDIGKLDTFFFPIAFLYRHCIELGLKAVGFQYIHSDTERIDFIKGTRHDLSELLCRLKIVCGYLPDEKELDWLGKLFADISVVDKESDSFRYPFHIKWEKDVCGDGRFTIKRVFDEQTSIDLVKFANKFEAAFEIIQKWYKDSEEESVEWKNLRPIFIENGGYYYAQSVVGYQYTRDDYYPYTKSYLECANFLKWFCKKKADEGELQYCNSLFFPMCYLYRNCVELSMKAILFEETAEDFQTKCKVMLDHKHSIHGLWKNVKPYALEASISDEEKEYLNIIEDYCNQIHSIDGDANKFRYPMSNNMQPYFPSNKRFDFAHVGDFFEELNNILDGIDCQLNMINEYKAEMEAEYRSEMMANIDWDYN